MNTRKLLRRSLKRNITLLIISEFFAETRFYMPIALLIFASLTGSFTMGMSIFSVTALMAALFEIPTGIISDRWGRRGTCILCSMAEATAVTCYTLAFVFRDHCLWFLYAGATFYGFANALLSGNNQALVYDTLASYKRTDEIGTVLGRISSMGQVALGLCGIITGLLLWFGIDYFSLMLLSLVSLFVNVLLAFLTIEPPCHYVNEADSWAHMKKAIKLLAHNKKLRLFAVASALQGGAGHANYYFTAGFVDSVWPAWLTPVYRTGQHMIGALGFWHAGRFVKYFKPIKILAFGTFITNIVALASYAMANVFSPLLLMFTQLSYAFGSTADRAVQHEAFSDAQRATMGSLISFCTAMITAGAALLMGWISDNSTPAFAMFSVLLGRACVVNTIYFRLYKKHK